MSFPRLVLSGDPAKRSITNIQVQYDNDTTTLKPAYLTRSKYDVKRLTRIENVSVGTAERYPDLSYDSFRLMHTWIGYIDVLTESVAITDNSTAQDGLTVNLIKTAAILFMDQGAEHTIASFDPSELGPNNPSLAGIYERAFEQGLSWVYNITTDGQTPPTYSTETTIYWFIRDINIFDNGDNTSRVTFTFEFLEPWVNLADTINSLST